MIVFCSTLVAGSSRAIGLDAFGRSGTDGDTRKNTPNKNVVIDLGKPIRNSSGLTFALKGILGFGKAKLSKDFKASWNVIKYTQVDGFLPCKTKFQEVSNFCMQSHFQYLLQVL